MLNHTLKEDSPFDRQERIPWWNQDRLDHARVMVAGAGALGNEVLKNLALLGVGSLLVVDFDTIKNSNLSRAVLFRQADVNGRKAKIAVERARRLNPNPAATVRAIHGDLVWELGSGVYRHVDLVIGCLDNIEARLTINEGCWKAGIPWIDGGMYELSGSVAVYDSTPERACYECGMDEEAYRRARERYSCTGQAVKTNIQQGREPTTQTTSALIGALQSQEAIKLLHGLESFAGRKAVYQGYSQNFDLPAPSAFMVVQLPINPDCLCHNYQPQYEEVIELPWATAGRTSARELLRFAEDKRKVETPCLELGRDFAIEAACPICDQRNALEKPGFRVTDQELACPVCEVTCPLCGAKSRREPDCPECGQTDINEREVIALHQLRLDQETCKPFLDEPLTNLA
jgi:adenylyltransferase/sulfurtransferase